MYDYLTGRLAAKRPTHVVIDVNGVGYMMDVPLSTYEKLPDAGSTVTLHTVVRIQDDVIRIFGFATPGERAIFLQLVEVVSGLGPRKALGILSSTSPEEFSQAIESGDAGKLQRIRGIGPKLANRLVVEMAGRLPKTAEGFDDPAASLKKDVVQALVSLGYPRADAEKAAERAGKGMDGDARSLEDWVRAALQSL